MDIALLIPTKNKSHFINNLLNYYSINKFKGRIYIADSSDDLEYEKTIKIVELNMSLSITHIRCKGMDINDAMLHAASLAKETYCVFTGDDDYLIVKDIQKYIDFLNSNSEYVGAFGKQYIYHFYRIFGINFTSHIEKYGLDSSFDLANKLNRLNQLKIKYWVPIFSIHRRTAFVSALSHERVADRSFNLELILVYLLAVRGKYKYINLDYMVRVENVKRVLSADSVCIKSWVSSEVWLNSFEKFLLIISRELPGISQSQAFSEVSSSILEYCLRRVEFEKDNKNKFKFIKKFTPKSLYHFFRFIYHRLLLELKFMNNSISLSNEVKNIIIFINLKFRK